MKRTYWLGVVVVAGSLGGFAQTAHADGCYLCDGGGYVAFKGEDTFDKRKAADAQFKCKVGGTTSSCSNPKGTVSLRSLPSNERVACAPEPQEEETKKGKKKKPLGQVGA